MRYPPALDHYLAILRKLNGVLGQVDHDLLEAVLVSISHDLIRRVDFQHVAILLGVLEHLLLQVAQDDAGVELALGQLALARPDSFIVQVLVDQANQALGFPLHQGNGLGDGFFGNGIIRQPFQKPIDRRQRRPHLMGHVLHELISPFLLRLDLFIGLLQGDHHLIKVF